MPAFDPEYLAAIEREQWRLIDEELARLRTVRLRKPYQHGPWSRTPPAVKQAIDEAAREQQEELEWARQRETWPEYAARWLKRIESMGC
jgi:hypothetical protein